MEKRGIRSVLVSTDEFGPLASIEAEVKEVDEFRMVLMAHPIGGRPEAEIKEKCSAIYPQLKQALALDDN